eukprot:CAMPEP_0194673438 /NCGR_PEP_ID=MMETSP0295-20121207/7056_1 /TAXON_ID=39354 /ORGANISM="Heterosigma akashiwo, Strain CCMP2393" /LENGTH=53 /DNA_ID=CAMNT_0039557369 /DNA_START=91 /DNA_END=248 /DNA_ORIENTATION=+
MFCCSLFLSEYLSISDSSLTLLRKYGAACARRARARALRAARASAASGACGGG